MFDQGSEYAFDIKYHKLSKTNKRKKTQPQKKSLRLVPWACFTFISISYKTNVIVILFE